MKAKVLNKRTSSLKKALSVLNTEKLLYWDVSIEKASLILQITESVSQQPTETRKSYLSLSSCIQEVIQVGSSSPEIVHFFSRMQ